MSDALEPIDSYFDYSTGRSWLAYAAEVIEGNLRKNGFKFEEQPHRQVFAIAEEAGEMVGAYRRWQGMARRTDTEEHVQEELADVVISSFVMAEERDWDLDEIIRRKMEKILTRGWRNENDV